MQNEIRIVVKGPRVSGIWAAAAESGPDDPPVTVPLERGENELVAILTNESESEEATVVDIDTEAFPAAGQPSIVGDVVPAVPVTIAPGATIELPVVVQVLADARVDHATILRIVQVREVA